MRRTLLLLALVVQACAAPVAAPAMFFPAPEPPPEPPSGIAGVVADEGSSEPLPNAIVILRGEPSTSRETTTNAAGRFFIADVPAGTYSLQVLYGEAEVTREVVHDGDSRTRTEVTLDPIGSPLG